jgi:hypothetical protein
VKCEYVNPKWLTYGASCGSRADFILTSHLLGYPSGKVASLPPLRVCMTHLTKKMADFTVDESRQFFGLTVMRLHEDDKIVLTPHFDTPRREIGQ